MSWALDRLSDRIEERLPRFLQYNYIGDPVSWYFSHPAWCFFGAFIGGRVGSIVGHFTVGNHVSYAAVLGWWFVAAIYAFIREPRDFRVNHTRYQGDEIFSWEKKRNRNPYPRPEAKQVGYGLDGILDNAGNILYGILLTRWLW